MGPFWMSPAMAPAPLPIHQDLSFHHNTFGVQNQISCGRLGIIVALGSYETVYGYAGDPQPSWIVPSHYFHSSALSRGYFYHDELLALLDDPTTEKIAQQCMMTMLERIFFQHLLIHPPDIYVIFLENMIFSTKFKSMLAHLVFKRFKVPLAFFHPQLPLSLIGLELHTALMVDVGYSQTTVISIAFDSVLIETLQTLSLGTRNIHIEMEKILRHHALQVDLQYMDKEDCEILSFATPLFTNNNMTLNRQALDEICRRFCEIKSKSSVSLSSLSSPSSHLIPDFDRDPDEDTSFYVRCIFSMSKFLLLSPKLLHQSPEILFHSEDPEQSTVATAILNCIMASPIDLRRSIASHITLIGGTCLLSGFRSRLEDELNDLVSYDVRFQPLKPLREHFAFTYQYHGYDPRYLGWIGASIISCFLGYLKNSSIKDKEYLEKTKNLPDWTNLNNISTLLESRIT